MPVTPAQGTLQNVGDIVGPVFLGMTGVANPIDVTAIVSLTGAFTGATVAIEGVPIGQPLTPSSNPGQPGTPTQPSEWVPLGEVGVVDFQPVSSPVGPLNSTGLQGSGYAFNVPCGMHQQMRLRLVSISSGAIQGGIATLPFPVPTGFSAASSAVLELQRIRVGIELLLASTDNGDDLAKVVPTLLSPGS